MNEPLKDASVYNSSMKWFYSIRIAMEDAKNLGIERDSFEEILENVRQSNHLRVIMEWYE